MYTNKLTIMIDLQNIRTKINKIIKNHKDKNAQKNNLQHLKATKYRVNPNKEYLDKNNIPM